MKIVIIGGTGFIGSRLVQKLRAMGHEVVSASLSSGVNTLTGEGLPQALKGGDVVIDVTNGASFGDVDAFEFFRSSSRNILAAAANAGMGHYLALSVVGANWLVENDYFRAKVVQENLIRAAQLPHTILRSTQFFEFLDGIINEADTDGAIKLPSIVLRPIAAVDTVAALAEAALGEPINGITEVAGPQEHHLEDLARTLLAAREDARNVSSSKNTRYFGVDVAERFLLPRKNALSGEVRFDDWLHGSMTE